MDWSIIRLIIIFLGILLNILIYGIIIIICDVQKLRLEEKTKILL